MVLAFNKLSYDRIIEIAENPCPECELQNMTLKELEVLNERIDKMAEENPGDYILYAKIMRLKSFAMLKI